jgi:Family of unknown function (DUF6368)
MGPLAWVRLAHPLADDQVAELATWLSTVAGASRAVGNREWELHSLSAGRLGGVRNRHTDCAIGVALSPPDPTDEEESFSDGTIERLLGYVPRQRIEVFAGCNQPADHAVLGALVLTLARRYDAVVDLCWAIMPLDAVPLDAVPSTS